MIFEYTGNKTQSNGFGIASTLLLIIGFAALAFFFSLMDSLDDLQDYWLELIFVSIMGFGLVIGLFQKKAEIDVGNIILTSDTLSLHGYQSPIKEVHLDLYYQDQSLERYHVWDTEHQFSIYSRYEDDLSRFLQKQDDVSVNKFTQTSYYDDSPSFQISAGPRVLTYNLETGAFDIKDDGETISSGLPKTYAYDGRYISG